MPSTVRTISGTRSWSRCMGRPRPPSSRVHAATSPIHRFSFILMWIVRTLRYGDLIPFTSFCWVSLKIIILGTWTDLSINYFSGIMQQLLQRLEYLFTEEMKDWRKANDLRFVWQALHPNTRGLGLSLNCSWWPNIIHRAYPYPPPASSFLVFRCLLSHTSQFWSTEGTADSFQSNNKIKRICTFASRFCRFNLDLQGFLGIFKEWKK